MVDQPTRLEAVRKLDPANIDATMALAIAEFELGRRERADELMAEIERRAPGSPQLARLKQRLGVTK